MLVTLCSQGKRAMKSAKWTGSYVKWLKIEQSNKICYPIPKRKTMNTNLQDFLFLQSKFSTGKGKAREGKDGLPFSLSWLLLFCLRYQQESE